MTFADRIAPEAAPLDAVLGRLRPVAPLAVRRAGRALGATLAATRRSRWPEVAWKASSLTNTGYPVEMSWSSRDASVRWTAEAAGPETPEPERLGSAQRVLHHLGADTDVPPWLMPHAGRGLRFGAWVSGRHDGERDRYKLYVDMADAELPGELLRPSIQRSIPSRMVWRMAGVDAGAGTVELYGRLQKPEIWEIERLLVRCGLDASAVIDVASHLTGRNCDDYLLPGTAGLSLATHDGRLVAAGFFVHAGPLLGGDTAVTSKVRELAVRYGWDTTIYEALLGTAGSDRPGRHGMIGFGVAGDGRPWMQVGLRP
ncbi:hypothetical protein [Iodidimonas sp. SYSU 1G8]|uniref:hypothetical protein n=1 Tax=Iodidimonas sp. SYSU 1G8 TaxID=3133967 RepID=UPI0031FE6F96